MPSDRTRPHRPEVFVGRVSSDGRDATRPVGSASSASSRGTHEHQIRTASMLLVVSQGLVGVWAYVFPHGFHTGFPVPDARWLSPLGAYDGHLVRDLGIAWIALAMVGTWAARRGTLDALRAVLRALLVSGFLHLGYHLTTFEYFGPAAMASQLTALTALLIVPAVLLIASRPRSGVAP
jgi:hypothetical protein